MKQREKTRYELFVRVRDFGAVNVDTFPASSPGGLAFAVVAEAVNTFMAHTTAKRLATTEGRKVKAQKRSAVLRQMQEIARTAKGVAREMPGIDRDLQVPERRSDVVLVTTARSMVTALEGITGKFVHLGLASSFVDDLRAAADTLERSHDRRQSSRKALTEAQTGVDGAIVRAFDAIRMLDIVVPNTLKSDPVRLAGWKRIRRLEGLPRARSSGVKVDVSPVPAPVAAEPATAATTMPPTTADTSSDPTPSSEALVPIPLQDAGLRRVS